MIQKFMAPGPDMPGGPGGMPGGPGGMPGGPGGMPGGPGGMPGGPGGMPGGPGGPPPMGPSKPGDPKELADFASVKNPEAISLCYVMELIEPTEKDGKFFIQADTPITPDVAATMAQKVTATDYVPAGPTLDDACAQLVAAMKAGEAGLPTLKVIPETISLDSLTISENDLYIAAPGKDLTMTVGGVGTNMKPGTYTDVTLTVTDSHTKSTGGPGGQHTHRYRAALFVNDGKIVEEKSVRAAILGGEVSGEKAIGLRIDDRQHLFNGVMITGGKYTIEGADLSFVGNGGNDFQGYGAGVMTTGDADVTVENSRVHVEGAIRSAMWCGGESHLYVKDTVIDSLDADAYDQDFRSLSVPMMKTVPFALGLVGNCRSTNVLDAGQVVYDNCIVVAENWAPLSTDSGYPPTSLTVKNVLAGVGHLEEAVPGKEYTATKTVAGKTWGYTMGGSGYIAYGDGGVVDTIEDSELYSPDYILICTGKNPMTFKNVTGKAGRAGFMWHQAQGGELIVEGGKYDLDQCAFLIKSGAYVNIDVKGAQMNLAPGGVLIQQLESDDAGGIITRKYVVPAQEDDWASVAPAQKEIPDSTAVFTGEVLTGDIYNSVYGAKHGLAVTLKDSTLTGVVSSSNANHLNADGTVAPGGTVFELDNHWDAKTTADYKVIDPNAYLYAGRVKNTVSPAVNNAVKLTLEAGSVWNVAGTSYLTALAFSKDSKVNGTITVNGTVVEAPGSYVGEIVVTA